MPFGLEVKNRKESGFGEALEIAVFLQDIWRELSEEDVGKTDNKTLESAIGSTKRVSNKKLRIDLAAIKKAIALGEVERVEWIESRKQVANGLTKIGRRDGLLVEYILMTKEEKERGGR